jgi:hypothetical protein
MLPVPRALAVTFTLVAIGVTSCGGTTEHDVTRREALSAVNGLPQDGITLGENTAPATLEARLNVDNLRLAGFFAQDLPRLRSMIKNGQLRVQIRTLTVPNDDASTALARLAHAAGLEDALWNFLAVVASDYDGALVPGAEGRLLALTPGVSRGIVATHAADERVLAAVQRAGTFTRGGADFTLSRKNGSSVGLASQSPGHLAESVRRALGATRA